MKLTKNKWPASKLIIDRRLEDISKKNFSHKLIENKTGETDTHWRSSLKVVGLTLRIGGIIKCCHDAEGLKLENVNQWSHLSALLRYVF